MNLQEIEILIGQGALDAAWQLLTEPDDADSAIEPQRLFLMGVILHQQGDLDGAEKAYRASEQINGGHATLLTNLAHLLGNYRQNPAEAVALLRRVLDMAPGYVDASLLLADFLREMGNAEEGSVIMRQLIQAQPENQALQAHAMTFHLSEQQIAEAALLAGKAGDEGLLQLSFAMQSLNLFDSAEYILQQLEQHYPDDAAGSAHINRMRGVIALQTNDCERAVPLLLDALHAGIEDSNLHVSIAWALMSCKRYQDAWPHFVHRATPFWIRDRDIPAWNGQPLAGKTICINSEQGGGDVINSLRFLPLLQNMGARVILDTYPDILAMLAECEGARADDIAVDDYRQIGIDYQVRLLDIPAVLNLALEQIPNQPYLMPARSRIDRWQAILAARLPARGRLRVGIVWAGNPALGRDINRSTALEEWSELFLLPGIDWVSLQKGPSEAELEVCPFEGVHLGPELQTFSDTAAVIANLDLVISVCTSVAHLTGAMGKPVWVLITSRNSDYRWHLHDSGSHWYPSARLFRQSQPGGWRELLSGEVRAALARLVLDGDHAEREADIAWLRLSCARSDVAIDTWLAALEEEDMPQARRRGMARIEAGDARFFHALPHPAMDFALRAARRDWEAIELALQCEPSVAEHVPVRAWNCLIDGLLRHKRYEDAENWLSLMTELTPKSVESVILRGRLHGNRMQLDEAETLLREALRLVPRHSRACTSLAWVLGRNEKSEQVPALLQRAVQLDPLNFYAWRELGTLAWKTKSFLFADACGQQGFHASGEAADLNLRAGAIASMGRWEESLELRRRALELAPDDSSALQLLANTLQSFGRYAEAHPLMEAASRLAPDDKGVKMAFAWDLLAGGEMKRGWKTYAESMSVKKTVMTEWTGDELNGRHLLVFQDQGYGDLFQFAHLLRRIRGGRITLAVCHGAVELFQQQDWPCEVILVNDVCWDECAFDCYVAQMKLPFLLGADLVSPVETPPYLQVSREHRQALCSHMPDDGKLKVGFAWAGSIRYGNDATRSTRLVDWLDLAQLEGLSLYSLQKDTPSEQALQHPDFPMINLAIECNTFADTAAAIANLDLLICPDTGLAHLAGALGKPVWILLPCVGIDFRWLRERTDVPWYPTATLFRQQRTQSWRDVLAEVGQQLLLQYPQLSRRS